MATRTIVTSQPDVACDVCERRLLRGEQPDIFLAAGRRRTVCELCAPRAAHEGWMRERDSQSMTLPPLRARRGRSFFERLRQVGAGRPGAEGGDPPAPGARSARGGYDFLESPDGGQTPPAVRQGTATPAPAFPIGAAHDDPEAIELGGALTEGADTSFAGRAVEVFNASEFPRRVAGVARSLGAPQVNVRSAEHLESVIVIVVAWELSWYRYEVDLSEPTPEARSTAQGTELSELEREERVGNAVASESGTLSLTHL